MKEKVAIIGMSGLFPGSSTLDEFWSNLMQKKDLTGMAKEEDFGVNPDHFFQQEKGVVDKCYSLRGGYIRDFEFDPQGYQLDPDFLRKQDKLYQWSLYVAKEALRESGYLNHKHLLEKCGLVLGNLSFPTTSSHRLLSRVYSKTTEKALRQLFEYQDLAIRDGQQLRPDNEILKYTPSQMVAEGLGLGGTNYALDAACATSLYAIKLACDELLNGKSNMMLAGAVCASDQLFIHMGFSIFHAYAPRGEKFVPLDKNSAGLVSAEGAGIVVLKRLVDAERDGDKILGVIGGIGLSNDGRGKFLLSPNPKGQHLAFQRAYNMEDILPENTSYLECHATGTPLGDVTEMNSIADFFKQHNTKPVLGSVKSNMGHLLTAAGMSGLLKVLLSMEKNIIPPNINLKNPVEARNSWIGGDQMVLEPREWTEEHKQAGINSFGFGGTNAHMVVQNQTNRKAQLSEKESFKSSPMAIVGMDAHFGDCENLEEFYETIFYGKQHFTDLPAQRWKGFDADEKLLKAFGFKEGKAPRGAYIKDFEIDLLRYKIQPQEAETLEPQQALILKVADQALKDAGLREGQNVAVLIAMESELAIHHYLARWDVSWQLREAFDQYPLGLDNEQQKQLEETCKDLMFRRDGSQTPSQHTSFVGNIMASRIAALWDFNGPAFTISCGENSAFKALEVAQHMLSMKEVDAVVVGAVDFSGGLENVLLRQKQYQVNENVNPSLSFNAKDQGWLVGEGAGAVVLKRKDEIGEEKVYAVIDRIGPAKKTLNIAYQELAATGFPEEDRKELDQILNTESIQDLALGSVKANIGHTFAASGLASLIKTSLCLHHKFIPAVPNWDRPVRQAAFESTNYYFPTDSRPWILKTGQAKRRAAINALGGNQVLLSEQPSAVPVKRLGQRSFLHHNTPLLFTLKGDDGRELTQQLSALDIALDTDNSLSRIATQFHESAKTKDKNYCISLVGDDKGSLREEIKFFQTHLLDALEKKKSRKTPKGSYFTATPLGPKAKIAFVYPGSATAYTGLGRELFQLFPELHQYFSMLEPSIDDYMYADLLYPKILQQDAALKNIKEDAVAMMSIGVFYGAAYTQVLRNFFSIHPDLAFGYSMGECSTMYYSLGIWNPKYAKQFQKSPIFDYRFTGKLQLLAEQWNISTEEAMERWQSLILLAPRPAVEEQVAARENVFISFINTDREVVISGDKAACSAVAEALKCRYLELPFQNIIHTPFCRHEYDGLIEMHRFPVEEKPDVEFYSSRTNAPLPLDSQLIAENSTEVCCHRVDFPATVRSIFQKGHQIFIEVGANATCSGWISSILKGKDHLAVPVNQSKKADALAIVELLAKLASHGVNMDLSSLYESPEAVKPGRSFNKTIIPGGARIFDTLLSEENRAKFMQIPAGKKKQPAALLRIEQGVSGQRKANPVASLHPTVSSRQTEIQTMDTQLIRGSSTLPENREQIGENGLVIQDFSSGAHLGDKTIIFSQEDLEEFATGKIAKVFGDEYAIIDSYPRRVMLPQYPYLLVSRVTALKGKLNEYKPSFMQTEYDIPHGAWFTTDRQIPWAVSVESGQCDLLLISYLGIDFQNKGKLVYRLLDCTLTFVDDLPFEGQTLRYDISINSFVRNGENLLFFFSYRCYVQDRLVLKMDGGCAGFFTDEQLEEGNGVVYTDEEKKRRRNAEKKYFTPLLQTKKTSFSKEDLRHLINGDMEQCFDDESYYANERNPSLRLPPEKILMIDRITSVDLRGGAYGLGYIVAEKDLHPDDWYFPCHFRDDEVLAGSLQAEGGGNLLRFFMLMLGLQRLTKDARYQPVFDLPQKVRCRKQVTPNDTKLVYKLEIKEIGLIPNPYVIGDLEIISDGIVTVHFENLGLQLREKSNPRYLETGSGIHLPERSREALLNERDITTFALDNLSKCFGEEFKVYDGRTVSRQPNTDLQLISRVLSIDGERHQFKKPSTIYAEYDVPESPWYYEQNSAHTMPYSVLMEIALQPCGLLGAYLGSTLKYPDKNLYFRNLDGQGEMLDLPEGTDLRGKTISNKAVLVSSVALGGTILQNYTFECSVDGKVFYKGTSSFGFFPEAALETQIGLDKGNDVAPWYLQQNLQDKDFTRINLNSPYGKLKLFRAPQDKPHWKLSDGQLRFIDQLKIVKDGGQHGQGYIYASNPVKTYDWFFTCHFYQDPVMPGSLGIEAILQAMQTFAIQQQLDEGFDNPRFVQLPRHTTVWKYRGQILLDVKQMQLEIHLKSIEKKEGILALIGDAYLWRDGMRIYQITDIALGITEG